MFWFKLSTALAVASFLNLCVYLILRDLTDLSNYTLALIRTLTGLPIGVFITGWVLKSKFDK